MTKQLTIFTPTYNRKHTLPELYTSLCEQECHDFVWLIVDDGSTDGTEQLVESWREEGRVDICYLFQPNGGKMRAHNRAARECNTELLLCLDSDDVLFSPTTVGDLLAFYESRKTMFDKPDICGILTFKKMIGKEHHYKQTDKVKMKLGELKDYSDEIETALVFKTSVLRLFPFPEVEGEKFITEAIAFDLMDLEYSYLYYPMYTQTCEYQADGYTRNYLRVLLANPKGYSMYYNQCAKIGTRSLLSNVKQYIATSLLAGDKHLLKHSSKKLLTVLLFPLGYMQYRHFLKGHW